MIKRLLPILALIAASLLFTGCVSTNLSANLNENIDLSLVRSFYVVKLETDERGIQELIREALLERGFEATSGTESSIPANVDAIVTYQDNWMWDMTMYMLEINIQIRDPESRVEWASGNSFRTSLARKPPAFMINEVLTEIFGAN